jgi:hypothetical protein
MNTSRGGAFAHKKKAHPRDARRASVVGKCRRERDIRADELIKEPRPIDRPKRFNPLNEHAARGAGASSRTELLGMIYGDRAHPCTAS